MALGAGRSDVLRLVIGQGVTLAAIGIGAGVVAALGVTQFIKTLLYNVTASDPLSFALVATFLAVVAIVASYVPARRAMGVDPIIALRND
jgi:putative ABC transport system permease protein